MNSYAHVRWTEIGRNDLPTNKVNRNVCLTIMQIGVFFKAIILLLLSPAANGVFVCMYACLSLSGVGRCYDKGFVLRVTGRRTGR